MHEQYSTDRAAILGALTYAHGRMHYGACPCCGRRLVVITRPRDHSHEDKYVCPGCRWSAWEGDHERDMMRRYDLSSRDVDQIVRHFQRAEDRASSLAQTLVDAR